MPTLASRPHSTWVFTLRRFANTERVTHVSGMKRYPCGRNELT